MTVYLINTYSTDFICASEWRHTLTGNNKFIKNPKFSSQTQERKNIKDTYNNTNLINGVLIRQVGVGRVYVVAHLVEALRYRPEGHGFETKWGKWNFLLT
jgi:hypothetical protein